MARKWLDIGVIGHKWTQQEYKKGRFSNWLKSLKTLIIYLALESDAINANFDLVYSDAEIENHVRNRDRRTAQYHDPKIHPDYVF